MKKCFKEKPYCWVVACEGLVGKDLCAFFDKKEIEYIATGHTEADILDFSELEDLYNCYTPKYIFNCAAYANVDGAEKNLELAHDVNVKGVINLAKLSKKYGVKLIHIGTDYVFDGEKGSPYSEEDKTSPINVYGKTKLDGEKHLFEIQENAVCVRTSSVYGTKSGLITGILNALEKQDIMFGVSDQISGLTYTKYLVEILYAVKDFSGIFNYSNLGEVSRLDLVNSVCKIAKEKNMLIKCTKIDNVTQKQINRSAKRPRNSTLSTEKISEYLNCVSIPKWKEALYEYFEDVLC